MADNIAGQTSASSNDQLTNGTTQGSVVYDATTIVAADSTRVFTGFAAGPRILKGCVGRGICG